MLRESPRTRTRLYAAAVDSSEQQLERLPGRLGEREGALEVRLGGHRKALTVYEQI